MKKIYGDHSLQMAQNEFALPADSVVINFDCTVLPSEAQADTSQKKSPIIKTWISNIKNAFRKNSSDTIVPRRRERFHGLRRHKKDSLTTQ